MKIIDNFKQEVCTGVFKGVAFEDGLYFVFNLHHSVMA